MISTFIGFIGLGLSLAIPVGSLTIEMLKQGIRRGFCYAFTVSLGGLVADFVFVTLIYAGLAQFLLSPIPRLIMLIFGCLTLIYLGYDSIKESIKPIDISKSKDNALFQCFMSGFLISIVNPINIIFWVSIYGSVLASFLNKIDFKLTLLYSSAVFIGVIIWDLFVSTFIHFSLRLFNPSIVKLLSVVAGICLIGFGIYFGIKAISLMQIMNYLKFI